MITIRPAGLADADAVLSLIDALADYEALDRPSTEARGRLKRDGFEASPPRFTTFIALEDQTPVGYTILFETYSTFLAQPTLYIEDLFILPAARSKGVGDSMFRRICEEAQVRGCGRMEWTCLEWNQLAIGFYEKRGAKNMDEWRFYRLTEAQFKTIAAGPPAGAEL